jgi:hypothetical protein
MNEHADPISFLIDFAWANGADRFVVNNAKDELNKLREKILDLEYKVIGYARINNRGDIYDLRVVHNPYIDETRCIAVYSNQKEFKEKYGKLSQ